MRPCRAAAIERWDRYRCSCNREIDVNRVGDARSCTECHASDVTNAVARAAGQFLGQCRQVSVLLRHSGRHDLRGIPGQTMLERRTHRRVSTTPFCRSFYCLFIRFFFLISRMTRKNEISFTYKRKIDHYSRLRKFTHVFTANIEGKIIRDKSYSISSAFRNSSFFRKSYFTTRV